MSHNSLGSIDLHTLLKPYDFNQAEELGDDFQDINHEQNQWHYYDDLDLTDCDNISTTSQNEGKTIGALKLLETLSESTDSEDESDSTDHEYNGPFVVKFCIPPYNIQNRDINIETNSEIWKQSFGFVYPDTKSVVLYFDSDKSLKLDLNINLNFNRAFIRRERYDEKHLNMIYLTGVYCVEKDKINDRPQDIIFSFSDNEKKTQFLKLLRVFIDIELDTKKSQVERNMAKNRSMYEKKRHDIPIHHVFPKYNLFNGFKQDIRKEMPQKLLKETI